MKLCVIGNSHAAAIKLGMDRMQHDRRDFEVQFFAARGGQLGDFRLDGRSLVLSDPEVAREVKLYSNGLDRIDVDDYDAFLLVGLGIGLVKAMGAFSRHRTVETLGTAKSPELISDDALDATILAMFRKSIACEIAAMIRAVDARKPIAIAPLPNVTHGYIQNDRKTFWRDAEILAPRLEPILEQAIEQVETDLNVIYVRQPEHTIDRRFFTKTEFSQGSVRLQENFDVSHPQEEHRHMNAAYGQAVLEVALPLLGIVAMAAETPRTYAART